ncbi:MAG: hypothetical protein ACYC6N_03715 [Pirellulaceae bacterium]
MNPQSNSQWINRTRVGTDNLLAGWYHYQTTFDLTDFVLSTVRIDGSWATDNQSQIWLNGAYTDVSKGLRGFEQMADFSLTSGFISGMNTLEFRVYNDPGSPAGNNSTGLQVQIVSAAGVVPTPSALTGLFSMGLVMGLFTVFRRRKPR